MNYLVSTLSCIEPQSLPLDRSASLTAASHSSCKAWVRRGRFEPDDVPRRYSRLRTGFVRMGARGTVDCFRACSSIVLVFRPGLASASNDNSVRSLKAHLGTHLLRLGSRGSESLLILV
ncbi:hypothetical protein KC19_10G121400 [Ceratodon purpureus]|uniref:Uncharacterized protein n=1 Tax=Ceratodon purpureus TaxID=3225 RepID=A0A8T0GRS5_CERPU|nr:hypothetical protein KC19_10G121400 [Ceratodon purpureus]